MADPNLYSLMFDDQPTADEHAAALVAALRGQQQQVQQRDAIASIASMGQNPLLQGMARGQLQRVGQQETDIRDQQGQLLQAGERRLQRQVEAKRFADQEANQQTMLTQRLGAESKENALNRANQLLMERERMAAELQREQDRATKAAAPTPLPEQETSKIVNMGQSLDALKKLRDQFKAAGTFSPNENTKFELMKSALAPIIAAGASPNARENPALMEEFKKGMPGVSSIPGLSTRDANGAAWFDNMEQMVRNNMAAQTAALAASGKYDKSQVQELQRQFGGGGAPAAGPVQIKSQADYDALPPGAEYIAPNGKHKRKL